MRKPKWIYCKVFRVNYYFFIGWKYADFMGYMSKRVGVDIPSGSGDGYTLMTDDGRIYVWTRIKKDYPVLAHEVLHAVNFTLQRIGHKSDFNNDEIQAYMQTYLMGEVLK